MNRDPQNNRRLLEALCAARFEFVVVGGVAAVLHGASRLTVDLDVAAPFTEENLTRLLDALRPHRPMHATRPDLSLLDQRVQVLSRGQLIQVKRAVGRPKDIEVALELEALAEAEA